LSLSGITAAGVSAGARSVATDCRDPFYAMAVTTVVEVHREAVASASSTGAV
jgi:hypothetical protein